MFLPAARSVRLFRLAGINRCRGLQWRRQQRLRAVQPQHASDGDLVSVRGYAYRKRLRPDDPQRFDLVATGRFQRQRQAGFLLYNAGTRRTVVWYLNNNVYAGAALVPLCRSAGA